MARNALYQELHRCDDVNNLAWLRSKQGRPCSKRGTSAIRNLLSVAMFSLTGAISSSRSREEQSGGGSHIATYGLLLDGMAFLYLLAAERSFKDA